MSNVVIHTTVMGFRVSVDSRGTLKGTQLSLNNFTDQFIHRKYDRHEGMFVFINRYMYFDRVNEICYYPKFALDEFCNLLTINGVSYTVEVLTPEEGKHVNFYMLPFVSFKNDKQKNAVDFLTNPAIGKLRGLGLQTGTGKTVAYIMALQKLCRRSMTVMTSRLDQWGAELMKYTTLDESDIYLIQGVASLTKLINQIDDDLKPKIILASSQTIRRYIEYGPTYQHLPHPSTMCEKLGIGVIGTDEYHEHFYTNFLIGLILNPDIFIPITATFMASDDYVKSLFNRFIPTDKQFVGGEYDRYVNVTSYTYRSGGHMIKPHHYRGRQGYSQQIFEKFLTGGKGKQVLEYLINDAIIPIIRNHYIDICDDGEKLLVLCATTKLCDVLLAVFKRNFNSKTCAVFYSGMPTTILENYDIIISTPGSAGTGRDVKNLRTCFAFENTQSDIRNLQFIGRLRPYPAVKNTPEFVYISFACIPQHNTYASARSVLYGTRAKTFRHRSIS